MIVWLVARRMMFTRVSSVERRRTRRAARWARWALALVAPALAGGSCARAGDAQVPAIVRSTSVAEDTSVARLLAAVRGVNPLSCELATRAVDMHGYWSRWGSLGGNPLVVDSTAAELLRWIQRDHADPTVVPRLTRAMRDPDGCVRRVAGSFLGRVQHPTAVAALVAALDDPSADTRVVAALGLGLSDEPRPNALTPLLGRLQDASAAARRAAAWSLGSLEDRGALLPLIDVLQRDADPRVRQAAAWAIGKISG